MGFQVKVGMEHSRPRKQTASQYLLSLPDTLRMQKSCGAARHQKVLRLLGACGLVGSRGGRAGANTGSGSVLPPVLSPKTIMDHSLGYAGSQGLSILSSWSAMLIFVPFPCSHYSALAQTLISEVSACICLLTSLLAPSLVLSFVSLVHGCQVNLPEIPLGPRNFLASKLSLASGYWQRSRSPGAAAFLSSFSP